MSDDMTFVELLTTAYYGGLRNVLTNAMLGMSAFLFAMMSFGLSSLKTNLLDDDRYIDNYAEKLNRFDGMPSIYTPLERVYYVSIGSIILAFTSSALHVSQFVWREEWVMWGGLSLSLLAVIGFVWLVVGLSLELYPVIQTLKEDADAEVKRRANERKRYKSGA